MLSPAMIRGEDDPIYKDHRIQQILKTIDENFAALDIRSIVMLTYSLSRMRLPAASLYKKILDSIEPNYKDIEAKDCAVLLWSFGRLRMSNEKVSII